MLVGIVLGLPNRFKFSLAVELVGVRDALSHLFTQHLNWECFYKSLHSNWMDLANMPSLEKIGKYLNGLTFSWDESKHKHSPHTFPSVSCGCSLKCMGLHKGVTFPRPVKGVSDYNSRKHNKSRKKIEL